MLGLLFFAVAPAARNRQISGAEFAAATLLMLLASTITWYAHYVTAIIVIFAAVGLMASDRVWRPRALLFSTAAFVLAIAVLAPVFIGSVTSAAQLISLSHSPWWWPIMQVASLPAIGADSDVRGPDRQAATGVLTFTIPQGGPGSLLHMARQSNLDSARLRRDLGLARARRVTIYSAVGATAFTGVFALVAATSLPGALRRPPRRRRNRA